MTDPISRSDAKAAIDLMKSLGGLARTAIKITLDNLPALDGDGKPKLWAFLPNDEHPNWWYRQGDDLWESARVRGVAGHCCSRNLFVDRRRSDESALKLYDLDLTSGDAAKGE